MAFSASNMASEARVAARSTSGVRGAGLGCMGLARRLANSHQSHTVSAAAGCAKTRAATAATFRYARRMLSTPAQVFSLRRYTRHERRTRCVLVIYYTITPYHRASVSCLFTDIQGRERPPRAGPRATRQISFGRAQAVALLLVTRGALPQDDTALPEETARENSV